MGLFKKIERIRKASKKHHVGRKINNTIQKTARVVGGVAPIAALAIPGALPFAGGAMLAAGAAASTSNAIYNGLKNKKSIKKEAI